MIRGQFAIVCYVYLALRYQPLEYLPEGPKGDVAEPGKIPFVMVKVRLEGIHALDQIGINAALRIGQTPSAFNPEDWLPLVINQDPTPDLLSEPVQDGISAVRY